MKRILFALALIVIGCIFTTAALATPFDTETFGKVDRIGVHTLTRHDPGYGANDINLGVFVVTDKNYTIGTYYNSIRKQSYYVGMSTNEWYRVTITGALVTGYWWAVTPVIIQSIRLYSFDQGPSIFLSGGPKLNDDGQSILHITAVWRLK